MELIIQLIQMNIIIIQIIISNCIQLHFNDIVRKTHDVKPHNGVSDLQSFRSVCLNSHYTVSLFMVEKKHINKKSKQIFACRLYALFDRNI